MSLCNTQCSLSEEEIMVLQNVEYQSAAGALQLKYGLSKWVADNKNLYRLLPCVWLHFERVCQSAGITKRIDFRDLKYWIYIRLESYYNNGRCTVVSFRNWDSKLAGAVEDLLCWSWIENEMTTEV